MRRNHSLRASDAERDAVVDRLRDAAGEGRLEPDELEQRVDRALRARNLGDLAALLGDIPGDGRVLSRRPGRTTHPAARAAVLGAELLLAVTVAVAVVAMVTLLVVAAAARLIAFVLFWIVRYASRRRPSVTARHVPTGSL